MEIKKLLTWVPIMAAVLGTLYTGINTIIKLNNTIEKHTLQLREMSTTISAIDERFSIEVKNLNRAYTEGREEVFREMTNARTELATARAKVEALNDSYYKMSNSVEDLKYDLKDFKREVTGDY